MATQQFQIRMPERAAERLEQIARDRGFIGGPGRHGGDTPNRAEAVRWLLGQADEKLFQIFYAGEENRDG
jgi:hypothetical protein